MHFSNYSSRRFIKLADNTGGLYFITDGFCKFYSQLYPGWEKTQILQDPGRLSCKILQVNALTWQISCKNLAR